MNIQPGDIVDGRYRVIERLGDGGFALVFTAVEDLLSRTVAIKFLHENLYEPNLLRRFEQEGKILSLLTHDNIVRFYRFGLLDNANPYIVMEHVQGRSLRALLNGNGPLKLDLVFQIARDVCRGLSEAHGQGIVHRDLKPANIILSDENQTKIVDFGVSKILAESDQSGKLTRTGAVVGSVHYMSPEQCSGQAIDHRCDLYALGCIMFELLTGKPPFQGESVPAILTMHLQAPLPVLEKLPGREPLPAGLNNFFRKILSKDLQTRFQSAAEVEAALALLMAKRGDEINAPPEARKSRTARFVMLLMLIMVLALGLALTEYITRLSTPPAGITSKKTARPSLSATRLLQPAELVKQANSQKDLSEQDYMINYYRSWLRDHASENPSSAAEANVRLGTLLLRTSRSNNWNDYLEKADQYYAKVISNNHHGVAAPLLEDAYIERTSIASLRGRAQDAFDISMAGIGACPELLQSQRGSEFCALVVDVAVSLRRFDQAADYAGKMLEYESIRSDTSYRLMWTFRLAEYCFLCHRMNDGNKAMDEGLAVLKDVDDPVKQMEGQFNYARALRVKGDFESALRTLDNVISSASKLGRTNVIVSARSMRIVLLDRLGRTEQAISEMTDLYKVAQGITLARELTHVVLLANQGNKQTKMDYIIEQSLGARLTKTDWNELLASLSQYCDSLGSSRHKDKLSTSLLRFKQLASQTRP